MHRIEADMGTVLIKVQIILVPTILKTTLQAAIFHTLHGYIVVMILLLLPVRVHKDAIVVLLLWPIFVKNMLEGIGSHFVRTANVLLAIGKQSIPID